MHPRYIVVLSAAAITLTLASCGSDSEGKAPSKADYIASADKICATLAKKVEDADNALGQSPTEADFDMFKRVAVPALKEEVKLLKALTPPKGDGARLDALYDSVGAMADKIDVTAAADIPALFQTDLFAAANRQATSYGFTECGR